MATFPIFILHFQQWVLYQHRVDTSSIDIHLPNVSFHIDFSNCTLSNLCSLPLLRAKLNTAQLVIWHKPWEIISSMRRSSITTRLLHSQMSACITLKSYNVNPWLGFILVVCSYSLASNDSKCSNWLLQVRLCIVSSILTHSNNNILNSLDDFTVCHLTAHQKQYSFNGAVLKE